MSVTSGNMSTKCLCCNTSVFDGAGHELFCGMYSLLRDVANSTPQLKEIMQNIVVFPHKGNTPWRLIDLHNDPKMRNWNVLSQLCALKKRNPAIFARYVTRKRQTRVLDIAHDLTYNLFANHELISGSFTRLEVADAYCRQQRLENNQLHMRRVRVRQTLGIRNKDSNNQMIGTDALA